MKYLHYYKYILITIIISVGFRISAHPSWGIVNTSDGTIYFVDVLHDNGTLWKYELGKEAPEKVFSGHFHAHNLQVDEDDNLYIGLHIWIDGEIMGDGENYLLKYNTHKEKLDTLAFSLSYQALFGGNIIYDQKCEDYYYPLDKQIMKANVQTKDAGVYNNHKFERISTMALDPHGKLWISDSFANGGSLYYIDSSGINTYASHLIPDYPENPVFEESRFHIFYEISFDNENNPIISDSASRTLARVNNEGKKTILYTSPKNYFPAGVSFVGDTMVIMEVGFVTGEGHKGPRLVIYDKGQKKIVNTF